LVSQYDGAISYIDLHLAKLIAKIKKLGFYENSLIIITSDHGECFGERNLIEHPVSVYQDQVHVLLIIKYPYTRKKGVEHEVVSLVDLMPTIMDVARLEIPDGVEGESLLTLSSGKSRTVISESFPYDWQLNLHPRFQREERAIFSKQFKFINSTSGKRELYDLSDDPGEKVNLYKPDLAAANELGTELSRWLTQESEVASEPINLEKDTIDRLKSLGYVQ
ncbi:MAG: sulfatase-like hydrolase/transferase, partial [Thermodesulfobacteriota bacterium]|nr:sulfatase-like hydrolase/transferase [Thermodesulfobacteriota bacterium]